MKDWAGLVGLCRALPCSGRARARFLQPDGRAGPGSGLEFSAPGFLKPGLNPARPEKCPGLLPPRACWWRDGEPPQIHYERRPTTSEEDDLGGCASDDIFSSASRAATLTHAPVHC